MTTLVWFRNDLRVADNPALSEACERGDVVACFVVSDAQWREHDVGDRRLAFLGRSVNALAAALARLGIPLEVLKAPRFVDVPAAIVALAKRIGAERVAFNAEYPLNEQRRDEAVSFALGAAGIGALCTHGGVTMPPGTVLTKKETPFTVFTPFKRRWLERLQIDQIRPLSAPAAQAAPVAPLELSDLAGVRLELEEATWPAGETAAHEHLDAFIDGHAEAYGTERNVPAAGATSRLSPYLSVGAVSSNQCLHAAAALNDGRLLGGPADAWIDQIIWRDFYRHVTAQFPHVSRGCAFRREYDRVQWREAPGELAAWQSGETGYPLVDAAMRQLVQTGWMHNRLRMVSAMFLTKHLLIDWRLGERFFMQQLVDGDFAANNGGWQWSASTGTDAAPYFRVFNPTTQGKKFDRDGAFTRSLLPELASVADRHLFQPHESGLALEYPRPIVEHGFARQRAIDAFGSIRATRR